MFNIILENIVVDHKVVYYNVSYSIELKDFFNTQQMFLEFPIDVSSVPHSILAIPFVATVLGVAWVENANLYVDELDSSFYYSLRELREAFRDMYSYASLKGRVVPCRIVDNTMGDSDKSLLLFGGGVDAHCSYLRHREEITHIVNIQGWFKSFCAEDTAADADKHHCEVFSERMGVKFDYVRSNFARLVCSRTFNKKYQKVLGDSWWHGIQHSMAFISIAIPIAYYYGISNIIIASSCTKGRTKPCASFVTTDSALRYALNGKVLHDAFELSRQQKMGVVVDFQKRTQTPYPLKVCSFNNRNCCECEKCFRTIIEIIAEGGKVQDFGFSIDGSLVNFFSEVLSRKLGLWGITFEREIYWHDTLQRMRSNYSNVQEKEFVDWFLDFDFDKAFRKSRMNYYKNNFVSIVRRRLKI